MTDLEKLILRCKAAVYLTVNEHRNVYQTVEETLDEAFCRECPPVIADDVREQMIARDALIVLQFYPDTPIGSYTVFHYAVSAALKMANEILDGAAK